MANDYNPSSNYTKRITHSSPYKISGKGWKEVLLRVKDQIGEDNLTITAAGVSFYSFLAIFPALIAIVSIYGLVVSPEQVNQQLSQLASVVPSEAFGIIEERITKLSETSSSALGWSTVLSILFALWSANAGMKALFIGINIAYDEKNQRSFIKANLLSLIFTLGSIVIAILAMAFIVGFPAFADGLGLNETLQTVIKWTRWPVLAFLVFGWFCLMYKYAPAEKKPTYKWVSIGALIATILWIIGSLGFSYYVSNFGNYDATYGSMSAVVILLFWLFITNFIILLGAEINSEAEQQKL